MFVDATRVFFLSGLPSSFIFPFASDFCCLIPSFLLTFGWFVVFDADQRQELLGVSIRWIGVGQDRLAVIDRYKGTD